jgi:hypothetical protein
MSIESGILIFEIRVSSIKQVGSIGHFKRNAQKAKSTG